MFDLDKMYAAVNTRAGNSRGFEFDGEDREIIFKHDVAGNLTFLNKTGELISGYSRQEAYGMNIAQFVAPEFVESVHDWVAGNSSKRLGTVYEVDIIAKNGQRIAMEVSSQAVARHGRAVEIEGIALPSVLRSLSQRPTRLRCLDEDLLLSRLARS
jgi:PAS domain S-box-containing protein